VEYEVIITNSALRDLKQIRAFIARDNPPVADEFCQKLLDAAQSLKAFPERGGFIAERPGVRFVMVHPYLVIYRVIEESLTVRVLRYWHGARERIRMRL
jgi:toxin ParE1/3/4